MNPQSYVQTKCPSCGAAAWGHVSQQVPCSTCGRQIPALSQGAAPAAWPQPAPVPQAAPPPGPFGAAGSAPMPAAQPYQAPPQQAQPAQPAQAKMSVNIGGFKVPFKVSAGPGMQFKIIGAVVVLIALGIAGVFVKGKFKGDSTAKGNLSYKKLGLDAHKIPVDEMVGSVESAAERWKHDAVFWSLNLQKVHADGTVDSKDGGNEIVYISMSGVQADSKPVREDSIKKFNFGPSGVDYSQQWGATDAWEDVTPPATPKCGVKDLMDKQLSKRGITGDKAVRISMDPDDYGVWHVWDPVNAYFSPDNCEELKAN